MDSDFITADLVSEEAVAVSARTGEDFGIRDLSSPSGSLLLAITPIEKNRDNAYTEVKLRKS